LGIAEGTGKNNRKERKGRKNSSWRSWRDPHPFPLPLAGEGEGEGISRKDQIVNLELETAARPEGKKSFATFVYFAVKNILRDR
jgi:hypothetical protein